MTLQYRERVDAPPRILKRLAPQSFSAQGYVWTSLVNMVDFQGETFAQKYILGRSERPYFARTHGWELQFWDPSTDNTKAMMDLVHPVATLDLRAVVHVEAFRVRHKFHRVNLGMADGTFFFHVKTEEEGDMWEQCIAQALIESTHMKRAQWREGVERAEDRVSRVVQAKPGFRQGDASSNEAPAMRFEVSPERQAGLRAVWIKCLHAVGDGTAPPPEAFAELFAIYNFDQDSDLSQDELDIMLLELLLVRRNELEKALRIQREQVVTPERIMLNPDALVIWKKKVGDVGNKLLKHFEHMLENKGFESRAVLLRSKLDTSHDGMVSLIEFVYGAPSFLMPQQELFREVQFYRGCKQMKEQFLEHHEKEEAGCLQQ